MWKISFIFGLMISIFWENLDKLSQVATIVAASAVVIAYLEYRRKRGKEATFTVVDELDFFRSKVLGEDNKIFEKVRKKNDKYDLKKIRLNKSLKNFDYASNYMEFRDQLVEQQSFEKEFEVAIEVANVTNLLEVFSWKVILNNDQDNEVLRVVHSSFVQLVERNAHFILFNIFDDKKKFKGIQSLYKHWLIEYVRETDEDKLTRAKMEAEEFIKKEK